MDRPIYKFWKLVRPHWLRLVVASICTAGIAACTSAVAYLIKPAMDRVFLAKDVSMLKLLTVGVLVLYLTKGLLTWANVYLMSLVNQKVILELRRKLFRRFLYLPLRFYDKAKTGNLISYITSDVNQVGTSISRATISLLRDSFTIVGLVWVIFQREWRLATISIIVLPFAFLPMIKFGKKLRRISFRRQESLGDLSSIIQEGLAGARVIKAFGTEKYEKDRFARENRRFFNYQLKGVKIDTMMAPLMEFFAGIGIVLIMWYGGYKVITGASTPGTFFSFITALIMLYEPVKRLSKVNNVIQNGLASLERLEAIEKEGEETGRKAPVEINEFRDRIEFKEVIFSYDGTPALKNLNLVIKKGQIVGIVGKSGSGKTTIVSLLLKFYEVDEGSIFVDEIDIRQICNRSLRSIISLVSQDPFLFDDTIRNNIAYARPSATEEEIVEAAKAAYAYDFISELPRGFETRVGEGGILLSGGQRQRICIARAFLKNAPILILDEATSSLDSASELQVKKAMENLMAGRTTIIIAHRFSSLEHAQKIFVLSCGEVVEEGTLEELMAKGGEFRYLHDLQACSLHS